MRKNRVRELESKGDGEEEGKKAKEKNDWGAPASPEQVDWNLSTCC